MGIKAFELFHGAVLTKLARSGRPISLVMLERGEDEAWSIYRVIDVIVYVKYSTVASVQKRVENALTWRFTFSPKHLQEIARYQLKGPVYVALVCASANVQDQNMQVCFLEPSEFADCLDVGSSRNEYVVVRYEPGKKLRVWGRANTARNPKLVACKSLDDWNIPGR